jgi:outer membrane protein assembly factor BamB
VPYRRLQFACLLALLCTPLSAADWTRFRGDDGTGISDLKGLPTSWSESDYDWRIELPGVGHAAPIVFGERLFVTSAVEEGAVRSLHCLNASTGEALWTRTIGLDRSHKHLKNSWATSTPCTDGERVYVVFADVENYTLAAYDYDGELVWRRRLGAFRSQHGQGVSPILFEDLVILANDQRGPSSVMAFDKETGDVRWSTLRAIRETAYSTPTITEVNGEPRLICASGASGLSSLDPRTGRVLWSSGEFPLRSVASPVVGGGVAIASCGQGGRGGVLQRAVDLETGAVKWERSRELPYVPTPIVYDGYLFEWGDNGIVACADLATGETVWKERVGGDNYSGSPVCVDGKLYCISERGEVTVVAARPKFELLGQNSLGESSHSTPAVGNGRLYLRTYSHLVSLPARG